MLALSVLCILVAALMGYRFIVSMAMFPAGFVFLLSTFTAVALHLF